MRELSFVGLSDDGAHLVLAGPDGQKYTAPIDERLTVAVRRDRTRLGQLEIDLEGGLRPREIQARIRAGMSAAEVAAASGLPLDKVERFEAPVLAERAYVAEKARETDVRGPDGLVPLETLVADRLESRGAAPATMRWDSWRRDDGRWVILLEWRGEGRTERSALWLYDVVARAVLPEDDEARRLVDDVAEETPATEAPTGPRLVSVPAVDEIADADADEEADADAEAASVYDQEADVTAPAEEPPLARRVRGKSEAGADAERDTVSIRRDSPPAGKQKRPAVPSWDEILFGSPKNPD